MKTVKEVAVRVENNPGELAKLTDLLGANGIGILGLTVRTHESAGIIDFLVTDPSRTSHILQSAGYTCELKEVIAAEVPAHPGGLQAILRPLRAAGVNIEYLYSCITGHNRSILILGVTDTTAGSDALSREWVRLFGEELYQF
jgi:hypothetical protein